MGIPGWSDDGTKSEGESRAEKGDEGSADYKGADYNDRRAEEKEKAELRKARERHVRLPKAEAIRRVREMGFRRTGGLSQGQKIFTNGKVFITYDNDSHDGGTWKMASTIKGLKNKDTRMGTYDGDLNWIAP